MIVRFDPTTELRRFFGHEVDNRPTEASRPSLSFDAVRRDDELELSFDLPGFAAEDVDISLAEGHLTLTAERTTDVEDGETYIRRGRWHGKLTRSLQLSDDVDADAAIATFDSGVLTLKLPVREQPGARKIEITTGSDTPIASSVAA